MRADGIGWKLPEFHRVLDVRKLVLRFDGSFRRDGGLPVPDLIAQIYGHEWSKAGQHSGRKEVDTIESP